MQRASVLALACALAPAAAQDRTTAAGVTEAVRTAGRALDVVLGRAEPETRTLFLLVDATPSLAAARFATALAAALDRNAAALAATRIGVARVGAKRAVVLGPTGDRAEVVRAVTRVVEAPSKVFQNVYASLRSLAGALGAKSGKREVLLVTLDNGDAEDDVEATVARLGRAGIVVHVLTSEAYLADSYWASHPYETGPRGTTLAGGDGPFLDLPWGWTFQVGQVNEVTPSGFAAYGLTRVAAATGGRVFVLAPPSAGTHACSYWGRFCPFCSGDHIAPSEIYWDARLQLLAPPAVSRRAAYRAASVDPYFRAVQKTWRTAARAGLIRSLPPKRSAGTIARGGSRRGRILPFSMSMNFARNAVRARKAAKECAGILAAFEQDLRRAARSTARPRQVAIAGLTRIFLQLTKVNLVTFAGWCEEVAPKLVAARPGTVEPPEVGPPDRHRAMGIAWRDLSLCHGVRPFYEVDLPGGAALRRELAALERLTTRYEAKWAHTPFAVALHRANIARFYLTYPGVAVAPPRPRPKSDRAGDPVTTPTRNRPKRTGATTGARPAGPTTGR